jgi:hypothetical protein
MPLRVLSLAEAWYKPPSEEAACKADASYVPAEFLIRPMSLAAQEAHQNCAGHEGALGTMVRLALKAGLRGARGLVDAGGKAVEFAGEGPQKEPTDAFLELLPWEVRVELWREIRTRSFLSEEQRKNSA